MVNSRTATTRRYLMCPPEHFDVTYAINPWMRPDQATDAGLALRQWATLRDTYLELGHDVRTIEPVPGLPDMVYSANGATVVDGKVLGARFKYPQRAAEAEAYLEWFRNSGYEDVREAW
jgi:N-dimethylarginine dimethylaminohydrolase